MTNLLIRYHSRFVQGKGLLLTCGAAIGLSVAILAPTNGSTSPLAMRLDNEVQSLILDYQDGLLIPVHCCHSHPYSPYDQYCCHPPGAVVGTAVVTGAVAYGAYRGVKSATKHHHHHHPGKAPGPRRHR